MAEGNIGAMDAMMSIMDQHRDIDPQAAMGGLGAILILDTWEIYGSDIYVLYSDKCGKDVRKMLMLMRAAQLGHFDHVRLQQMAADQSRKVNLTAEEWQKLDNDVCEQLADFQRA